MAEKAKSVTQTYKMDSEKKGSVIFKGPADDPLFLSVYLMREASKKLLGIEDLAKVSAVEITVKAVA